jgi:hypothetical protein
MSIESTLEQIAAIRQTMLDPATLIASSGGTEAPAQAGGSGFSSFASVLEQASGAYGTSNAAATPTSTELGTPPAGATAASLNSPAFSSGLGAGAYPLQSIDGVAGSSGLPAGGTGSEIVAVAEGQLGQTEQPPGSNESPAIAQYRTATAGAIPGAPWCAYFASWVARQAGEPIGEDGQGAGAVSEVWSWAQSTGRAIVNGPGVVPKPGDLIVFGDEHVGIVRDVLANGQIQTIEGNYENKVAANVRTPTEATGYVEMS